jgi:hypothetical protein
VALSLTGPPFPIPTHNQLTTWQYGSGGVFYMGAGILTLIANPQYNAYTVYFQVGAASDTFMGGAWLAGWLGLLVDAHNRLK